MPTTRRLLAVAFALLVTLGAAGVRPAPAAAADLTLSAAELEMVNQLNAQRARYGLRGVRVDNRLMTLARARSADMARYHYFSHTQPDGRNVFSLLRAAGIAWYGAGEIIAYNTSPTFAESMVKARDGWMASAGHRAIVLSNEYNYVGIGLAVDPTNGRKLWTGVFIKGPDRTGGWVRFNAAPRVALTLVRYQDALVTWTGGDIQLVSMTAGFKHYQTRIRTDGGAWVTLSSATTIPSKLVRVWRGHRYDLQVRACDKVLNCGSWKTLTLQG